MGSGSGTCPEASFGNQRTGRWGSLHSVPGSDADIVSWQLLQSLAQGMRFTAGAAAAQLQPTPVGTLRRWVPCRCRVLQLGL